MNYRKDFEKCIEYIEINMKNEIFTKNYKGEYHEYN